MASKLAENIARLAAVLHYFEYGDTCLTINQSTLKTAIDLGYYYANEFVRIFTQSQDDLTDFQLLFNWLKEKLKNAMQGDFQFVYYDNNVKCYFISKNIIKQYGPHRLRGSRMSTVLDQLLLNQYLDEFKTQPNGKVVYRLGQAFL